MLHWNFCLDEFTLIFLFFLVWNDLRSVEQSLRNKTTYLFQFTEVPFIPTFSSIFPPFYCSWFFFYQWRKMHWILFIIIFLINQTATIWVFLPSQVKCHDLIYISCHWVESSSHCFRFFFFFLRNVVALIRTAQFPLQRGCGCTRVFIVYL